MYSLILSLIFLILNFSSNFVLTDNRSGINFVTFVSENLILILVQFGTLFPTFV